MTTTTRRPIYLNLLQIRLPAPGLVSIGHRVSGLMLALCIPFAAYLLQLSLSGPAGFARATGILALGPVKMLLLVLGWGLLHHLFAGIRYLLIDMDLGVGKLAARKTAWLVLIGAALLTAVCGGILLP